MTHLSKQFFRRVGLPLLLAMAFVPSRAPGADGLVTECTEEALRAAITDALEGDGVVEFACDGTITLTNTVALTNEDSDTPISLTLDATGRGVTISSLTDTNATSAVRLFSVDTNIGLTLINLTLANGRSTNGGAIYNLGANTNVNCTFSNNIAIGTNGQSGRSFSTNAGALTGHKGGDAMPGQPASGGAIYNLGTLVLTECAFLTNTVFGGNGGVGGTGESGRALGGAGGRGGRGGSALGGAICNDATKTTRGELVLTNCSFNSNQAVGGTGGQGGAGAAGAFSGFNGNGAMGGAASGAAIYNKGLLTMVASTLALNNAFGGHSSAAGNSGIRGKRGPGGGESLGGGVCNLGSSTNVNCTFFGNSVSGGDGGNGGNSRSQGGRGGDGGGAWGGNVYSAHLFAATNCTFTDGGVLGGVGGGAGTGPFAGRNGVTGVSRGGNLANRSGPFYLKNCLLAFPVGGTIVSTNTTTTTNSTGVTNAIVSGNGYGRFTDRGFNLSSDHSIRFGKNSGSFITNDVKVGVLAQNGGPVETIELLTDSPAINAGDTNFHVATDARGVARPIGDVGDIGAYEAGLILGPPRIMQQPASRIVREDGSVTFSVGAQGDPPLLYQWRKRDDAGTNDLDGETSSSFTIDSVTDDDAGDYEVVVGNNSGSVTSDPATLTVVHPPSISVDLTNLVVDLGASFSLSVTAVGDPLLTYQWYTNDVPVLGATISAYSVSDTRAKDVGRYQVVVCNPYSCVTSAQAVVTFRNVVPSIVTPPSDYVVAVSNSVSLSVVAVGARPLFYQWYANGAPSAGATNATLSIASAQAADAGTYHAVVSNAFGTVTSASATLTVQTNPPSITVQPVDSVTLAGNDASFSVTTIGSAPLAYQWFFNTNTALSGGTNATLTLTNVQATNVGSYSVSVTNTLGSATSAPVSLTVVPVAPAIRTNPVSATVFTGDLATFTVSATGLDPLRYQWYFNATNLLPGAITSTLTITNAQLADVGSYLVTVTNSLGAVTSAPVTLSLTNSLPLITLQPGSVAANVGTNVSFTITVIGTKPMFYQWFFNDVALFSPTNASLTLTNPASGSWLLVTNGLIGSSLTVTSTLPGDEGAYKVSVSNTFGAVLSDEVLLDVLGFGSGM